MYANLRKAMKDNHVTQLNVADALGLSLRGFNLKLLHRSFVSEEMIAIHTTSSPPYPSQTLSNHPEGGGISGRFNF